MIDTLGKFVEYIVIRLLLFMFFVIATSPFMLLFFGIDKLLEKYELQSLNWILAFLGIGWFFWIGWMVKHTAEKIVFKNQRFWSAIKDSLHELRLYLFFVPVIGGWLERKKSETVQKPEDWT